MNIVVCAKQVPDTNIISITQDTNSIESEDLVYVVNPYDICAVNEAIQIKRKNTNSQVTVISMGTPSVKKTLRHCLAIGADRAMFLWDPAFANSDSYATAVILVKAISSLEFDLIFCGERAIDTEAGLVGAVIAYMLDIPLITSVVKIDVPSGGKEVIVQRKLNKGNREVVKSALPAVITVGSRLSEPRYASLPSLMHALRQDIEEYDLRLLGLSPEEVGSKGSRTNVVGLSPPKPRPKRLFSPDASLPATERLQILMSGGLVGRKTELLEGNPKEIALKLVQFFIQQKIL